MKIANLIFMLLEIEFFSRHTASNRTLEGGRFIFDGDKATIIWTKAILLSYVLISTCPPWTQYFTLPEHNMITSLPPHDLDDVQSPLLACWSSKATQCHVDDHEEALDNDSGAVDIVALIDSLASTGGPIIPLPVVK